MPVIPLGIGVLDFDAVALVACLHRLPAYTHGWHLPAVCYTWMRLRKRPAEYARVVLCVGARPAV